MLALFELNSTRYTDAGVKHLKVCISQSQTDTKFIIHIPNSHSDLSPVPVRLPMKSYLAPWLTVFTSTTWLSKQFQILTMHAVK